MFYAYGSETLLSTNAMDPDPERKVLAWSGQTFWPILRIRSNFYVTDTGLVREISLFSGANISNVDFELYFFQHCANNISDLKLKKMERFLTRLATKKCWEEQNSPQKQRTFYKGVDFRRNDSNALRERPLRNESSRIGVKSSHWKIVTPRILSTSVQNLIALEGWKYSGMTLWWR